MTKSNYAKGLPQRPINAVGSHAVPDVCDPCVCLYCGRRLLKPSAAKSHMRHCKARPSSYHVSVGVPEKECGEGANIIGEHRPTLEEQDAPADASKDGTQGIPQQDAPSLEEGSKEPPKDDSRSTSQNKVVQGETEEEYGEGAKIKGSHRPITETGHPADALKSGTQVPSHDQLQSGAVPKTTRPACKGKGWTEEELRRMALLELQLIGRGCNNINTTLSDMLKDRSITQIQARRRRADYLALRDALGKGGQKWTCHDCQETFMSQPGLGVHRASKHPAASNLDRIIKTTKVKSRWNDEEDWILARAIWKNREVSNTELASLLPGRSIEGVKKRKRQKMITDLVASFGKPPSPPSSSSSSSSSDEESESSSEDSSVADNTPPRAPPDPSDPSSDESEDSVVDPLEKLREAIKLPLSDEEERDERLNPRRLIELAEVGALSAESAEAHIRGVLEGITTPAPPRRPARTNRRPQPRLSNRRRRRQAYRHLQYLYSKDRSKAAESVLRRTWDAAPNRPSEEQMRRFWSPLLGQPDVEHDPSMEGARQHPELTNLQDPITVEEIIVSRKSMKKSATGPEGVTYETIMSLSAHSLARLYNLWLYTGRTPEAISVNRVTFIPKVHGSVDPSEYRPIAVGCHLVRHLHRILSVRLQALPISKSQMAFRSVDGCAANTAFLMHALQTARTTYRPLCMGFVDLRKAFDTASRKATLKAAKLKGVPDILLRYLRNAMHDAPLLVEGERVETHRGVKQGDPVSPILFNALIDVVLEVLEPGVGYSVGDLKVPTLCYADDMVFLANTPAGLQSMLTAIQGNLHQAGLAVNPAKCSTLHIATSVQNSAWSVNPTDFSINGQVLPKLTIDGAYKYLGLKFSPSGVRSTAFDALATSLENLSAAPLKPQQRLHILKHFALPKLYHQLALVNAGAGTLRRLDLKVRAFVRKFLRLPVDTPLGSYYAPIHEGGLGVPLLEVKARIWHRDRILNLLSIQEDEPLVHTLTRLPTFDRALEVATAPITLEGTEIPSKKALDDYMSTRLHRSVDGKGLAEQRLVPASANWVGNGATSLPGRTFIGAIQTRLGVLSTPTRESRRGGDQNPSCVPGCGRPCSLGHILQQCPVTHDIRVRRHDAILDLLESDIRATATTRVLAREPTLRTPEGVRKPDLVVDCGGDTLVVDVQVVSDMDLGTAHRMKCQRYSTDGVADAISRQLRDGQPLQTFRCTTLTVNWRGCVSPESARDLVHIGIPMWKTSGYSQRAVVGSFTTFTIFSRTAGGIGNRAGIG